VDALKDFEVDVALSPGERKALGALVRDALGPDAELEIERIAKLRVIVRVQLQEKKLIQPGEPR
jgi:hypothetical protein